MGPKRALSERDLHVLKPHRVVPGAPKRIEDVTHLYRRVEPCTGNQIQGDVVSRVTKRVAESTGLSIGAPSILYVCC